LKSVRDNIRADNQNKCAPVVLGCQHPTQVARLQF